MRITTHKYVQPNASRIRPATGAHKCAQLLRISPVLICIRNMFNNVQYMYVCTCVYACMYMYIYIYICVCVCVCSQPKQNIALITSLHASFIGVQYVCFVNKCPKSYVLNSQNSPPPRPPKHVSEMSPKQVPNPPKYLLKMSQHLSEHITKLMFMGGELSLVLNVSAR